MAQRALLVGLLAKRKLTCSQAMNRSKKGGPMRNILIVDDSDVDLMMIESLLKARGFLCVTAGDGMQALEKLKEWTIDLVLTDLNMPKMDGLELVQAMRKDYPRVPVILTTGAGSEETAAEALSLGASSYIPKHKLPEMLYHSVQRVLDIQDDSIATLSMDEYAKSFRFELEFDNDPQHLRSLVEFTERTLRIFSPLDHNERLRIAMAMDQALHNALYRGNLEIESDHKVPFVERLSDPKITQLVAARMESAPYRDRRLQVVCEIKKKRFALRIRDEGPGFDSKVAGKWDHPDHRGIILMRAFMDKVEYNDKGNDVQLFYFFDGDAETHGHQAGHGKSAEQQGSDVVAELTCRSSGSTVRLSRRKTVVGTRSECHIRLNSKHQVAPLHCMIVPDAQSWTLVHMSPQHASLVNMKRVIGRERLKDGDLITIGEYEFDLSIPTDA